MRVFLFLIAAAAGLGLSQGWAQDCGRKPTCKAMRSCAEADFYYRQCGHGERDGVNDGIPCEELCGKTMAQYSERRSDTGGF